MSSATAPAPGLVKLVRKSISGARVVVDVVVYGPEPDLALSGFAFGVRIGDRSLVQFVPQASYAQNALIAGDAQTIATDVDGRTDPSVVRVDVEKQGAGAGNGIAGTSAVVIELSFDVQGSGATSLTLVGLGADPPRAFNAARTPIAAVVFDDASASIRGVTSGGGGY
jgi:hypothetical protein